MHPITSYGAIAFRVRGGWSPEERFIQTDAHGLPNWMRKLEFLMIQRRDSIGFVEIMRGKYKLGDIPYITQQLEGMTREEHAKLLTLEFDQLWESLWGPPQEGSHAYRHEKEIARQKLESLRIGAPPLRDLIASIKTAWTTPEWGFPKGRKELHETEYACAMRELWEETNLKEKVIYPIRNLEPLVETFLGSNGVHYSHKYYIVYVPEEIADTVGMKVGAENPHLQREVGEIQWLSVEDCIKRIRPEHVEKKEVLLRAQLVLRNYCPVLLGASVATPALTTATTT